MAFSTEEAHLARLELAELTFFKACASEDDDALAVALQAWQRVGEDFARLAKDGHLSRGVLLAARDAASRVEIVSRNLASNAIAAEAETASFKSRCTEHRSSVSRPFNSRKRKAPSSRAPSFRSSPSSTPRTVFESSSSSNATKPSLQPHRTLSAAAGAAKRAKVEPSEDKLEAYEQSEVFLHCREWFVEHMDKPYPTVEVKKELAEECGVEVKQVESWFTNTRRRSGWTATLKTCASNDKALFASLVSRILRGDYAGIDDYVIDEVDDVRSSVAQDGSFAISAWLADLLNNRRAAVCKPPRTFKIRRSTRAADAMPEEEPEEEPEENEVDEVNAQVEVQSHGNRTASGSSTTSAAASSSRPTKPLPARATAPVPAAPSTVSPLDVAPSPSFSSSSSHPSPTPEFTYPTSPSGSSIDPSVLSLSLCTFLAARPFARLPLTPTQSAELRATAHASSDPDVIALLHEDDFKSLMEGLPGYEQQPAPAPVAVPSTSVRPVRSRFGAFSSSTATHPYARPASKFKSSLANWQQPSTPTSSRRFGAFAPASSSTTPPTPCLTPSPIPRTVFDVDFFGTPFEEGTRLLASGRECPPPTHTRSSPPLVVPSRPMYQASPSLLACSHPPPPTPYTPQTVLIRPGTTLPHVFCCRTHK